jgi:hypothetical protein
VKINDVTGSVAKIKNVQMRLNRTTVGSVEMFEKGSNSVGYFRGILMYPSHDCCIERSL